MAARSEIKEIQKNLKALKKKLEDLAEEEEEYKGKIPEDLDLEIQEVVKYSCLPPFCQKSITSQLRFVPKKRAPGRKAQKK
jgi:hypothetical protein